MPILKTCVAIWSHSEPGQNLTHFRTLRSHWWPSHTTWVIKRKLDYVWGALFTKAEKYKMHFRKIIIRTPLWSMVLHLKRAVCHFLENFLTWDLSNLAGRSMSLHCGSIIPPPLLTALQRCFVNCNQQMNYKNKQQQPRYYGMENNWEINENRERRYVQQWEGVTKKEGTGQTIAPGKQLSWKSKSKQDSDNPGQSLGNRLRVTRICVQSASHTSN